MFDFAKVFDVAVFLNQIEAEEYDRSAISRYYYSVFGCARLYLILIMNELEFCSRRDIHKKVSDRLKNSNNPTKNALGRILEELRDLRNLADYDWYNQDSEFYKKRVNFAQKESKTGLQQVEALKKSPPFKI